MDKFIVHFILIRQVDKKMSFSYVKDEELKPEHSLLKVTHW